VSRHPSWVLFVHFEKQGGWCVAECDHKTGHRSKRQEPGGEFFHRRIPVAHGPCAYKRGNSSGISSHHFDWSECNLWQSRWCTSYNNKRAQAANTVNLSRPSGHMFLSWWGRNDSGAGRAGAVTITIVIKTRPFCIIIKNYRLYHKRAFGLNGYRSDGRDGRLSISMSTSEWKFTIAFSEH
jgi:hypothetical protein